MLTGSVVPKWSKAESRPNFFSWPQLSNFRYVKSLKKLHEIQPSLKQAGRRRKELCSASPKLRCSEQLVHIEEQAIPSIYKWF
jgi:hypothetical protein